MDNALRPTVVAAIKALFAPKEREFIAEMLLEECNAEKLYTSSEEAVERIQLAVLKISNGDVEKFLTAAELVQIDWRDALMAAGFGNDVKAHLKWAESIRTTNFLSD